MGPAMHLLHLNIDRLVPRHVSYAAIKRLLVERLLITPPLMFVYLILLNMLQEVNKVCILTRQQGMITQHFCPVFFVQSNFEIMIGQDPL